VSEWDRKLISNGDAVRAALRFDVRTSALTARCCVQILELHKEVQLVRESQDDIEIKLESTKQQQNDLSTLLERLEAEACHAALLACSGLTGWWCPG
jgi:hypothetical protein